MFVYQNAPAILLYILHLYLSLTSVLQTNPTITCPNSSEIKADNYDKEKDTAQQENKQPASANNNTSTQEQEILKKQKETD